MNAYYNENDPYAAQWLRPMLDCATCHETKLPTAFAVDLSRQRGRRYSCLSCEARKAAARYTARPEHHRNLVRLSRQRNLAKALVRGAKKRAGKKTMPFDLDGHITEIEQRLSVGCCEMTRIQFDFDGARGGWRNPSIDRIDCHKGYVYANIRIILHGLNTAIGHWGEEVLLQMIAAWQAQR